MTTPPSAVPTWVADLPSEDLEFIRRLVLASGSLKDLAQQYGISYPTIRLRLDRVIARLKSSESVQDSDPMTRKIRSLLADGSIDPAVGKQLLDIYTNLSKGTKS